MGIKVWKIGETGGFKKEADARGKVAFARVEVVLARVEVGVGQPWCGVFHRLFHRISVFSRKSR